VEIKRAAAQPDIFNNRLMLNCYFINFGVPGSTSARRRRGFARSLPKAGDCHAFFVGAERKMQFAAIAFAVF
jgi:hypothetical protein